MELFRASYQWANRPDDERFASLTDLHTATKAYSEAAAESIGAFSSLRTEADKGEVVLVGKQNIPARLTHWAFGQLAARVAAPASYLRTLPATLAVQNLNHGLKRQEDQLGDANLLFHTNGSLVVRSITSDKYARIWNYEVAERLLGTEAQGWKVPRAHTDGQKPSGIYASDHDMFVFLVNESFRVQDGTPEGLGRGVFVSNSEVGGGALRIVKFLYRYVCGNHIVWGAKDVQDISVRHVGSAQERARVLFRTAIKEYANESASDQEAQIRSARSKVIAATKEEVLDAIFGKRILTRKAAEKAYAAVIPDIDGDPKTVWGFVQGITRASQETPYGDERTAMDTASGKVLSMAF